MSRVYAVAGWLLALGRSGASQRLLALLGALPELLAEDEEIVVLHAGAPPMAERPMAERPRLRWQSVAIAPQPTWRRALAERRILPPLLAELSASLLHLESLPVPRVACQVVLTVHDLRDLGTYRRRSRWLFARALQRGVARAAALVAPSRFTADELRAAAGAREVAVVPGAIDAQWVAGAATPSAWPGAFLHVGHLEPRKDLDTLLRAYANAAARAASLAKLPSLVLAGRDAGSGPHLRALAAQLQLGDRVHFLGAVDDATLRGLYRGARAVLVPSRYEGFGMPALEALAMGRAVVVSDQGACVEVVGDAGTVLAGGDVAAWAQALVHLAVTPDAASEGAARIARAATFNATRAAAALLAVWRRAADAGSQTRRAP